MTDERQTFSAEDIAQLITGIGQFLEAECQDYDFSDEDRGELAGRLAHWLLRDKTLTISPEKILPKARYHLGLNITDETSGDHIIRLILDRDKMMTDGDFLQMQNFFWCVVGRAIRDNPDIIKTLQAGGVRVEIDPPAQPAPGGAFA